MAAIDNVTVTPGQYASLTGTNTLTVAASLPPGKWQFLNAKHASDVAVTANDANYATFAVKKGATTVASRTTQTTAQTLGSGNIAQYAPTSLTQASGIGQNAVFDGDVDGVIFDIAKTGTGVTVQGQLTATFQKVP